MDADGTVLGLRRCDDGVTALAPDAAAEAPDCARDRRADGDNREAVDAVEIAEFTSF